MGKYTDRRRQSNSLLWYLRKFREEFHQEINDKRQQLKQGVKNDK